MGRSVDLDDLIGPDAIAELLGLSNVRGVSVYRTRYADFPDPVVSEGRCRLWLREDILKWLGTRRTSSEDPR
jgi:hypothetical protein